MEATVGKKKEVCFNVGGKWFFRKVDPNWKAPGGRTKVASAVAKAMAGQEGQRAWSKEITPVKYTLLITDVPRLNKTRRFNGVKIN
ncbi:hypothetical protein ACFL7M_11325 [Thermodesulfobacteriota bacterium]